MAASAQASPIEKDLVENIIKELVKPNILEPSQNPWATTVVFVKEPGVNNWCICGDYRDIDTVLRSDRYPMAAIMQPHSHCKDHILLRSIRVREATNF